MDSLKYTVIKSEKQYQKYCNILENLVESKNDLLNDEIELLTLLIVKWDEDHNMIKDLDPVELVKSIMEENNLKAVHLAKILGLSKGTISKILNYHKGFSKVTIRKLSEHFGISQEAFNRPYRLVSDVTGHLPARDIVKAKKRLGSSLSV